VDSQAAAAAAVAGVAAAEEALVAAALAVAAHRVAGKKLQHLFYFTFNPREKLIQLIGLCISFSLF
jgi:hypothetical protein